MTHVEFQRVQNGGYNSVEVDEFVAKISQHYSQLHEAYTEQQGKIDRLTREAQTTAYQTPIDINGIAKLMLDAELLAKQAKEESVESEKRLVDIQTQVRALEIQKETILDSIRQMAKDLTALTGGKDEDTFTGENQSRIYRETGTQHSLFTASSASGSEIITDIDEFLACSKAAFSIE